jgi:hypothetical protein
VAENRVLGQVLQNRVQECNSQKDQDPDRWARRLDLIESLSAVEPELLGQGSHARVPIRA